VLNQAAFSDALLAADLYDAILESRMGFRDEAIEKLVKLADAHEELPTLCLWLGDLYEARGHNGDAIRLWKVAIARDRSQSAVTLAARRQIKKLTKRQENTSRQMHQPVHAEFKRG
jgi:tetratricopeptide (TPR) repeat protein